MNRLYILQRGVFTVDADVEFGVASDCRREHAEIRRFVRDHSVEARTHGGRLTTIQHRVVERASCVQYTHTTVHDPLTTYTCYRCYDWYSRYKGVLR